MDNLKADDVIQYSEFALFLVPLIEPLPLPDNSSFLFTEEDIPATPQGPGPLVLQNKELPEEAMPTTSNSFVYVNVHRVDMFSGRVHVGDRAVEKVLSALLGKRPGKAELKDRATTPKLPSPVSVLELQTPILVKGEEGLDAAFNRTLKKAQVVIEAAGLVQMSAQSILNDVTLPALIRAYTRQISDEEWKKPQILLNSHWNDIKHDVPPVFDSQQMSRLLETLLHQKRNTPVVAYGRLRSDANRNHFVLGDYRTSVMLEYTASEQLLDVVLMGMLWEESKTAEDAAGFFIGRENLLAGRIKRHYAERLKGSGWSTEGSGPIAEWYKTTSYLRGRSVHAGYTPTHAEADESYRVSNLLRDTLVARFKSRASVYPRTASILTGQMPSGREAYMLAMNEFTKWRGQLTTARESG